MIRIVRKIFKGRIDLTMDAKKKIYMDRVLHYINLVNEANLK